MRICLTVSRIRGDAGGEPRHRFCFEQDEVLVGRDEAVEVRLPDPAVSFVHLQLLHKKGRLLATDRGSTNGTRLDGRALRADEPVEVRPGSRLEVGPFLLELEEPDRQAPTRPEDTAALARAMVLEALGGLAGADPDRYLSSLSAKPDVPLPVPVPVPAPSRPPSPVPVSLRLLLALAGLLLVAGVAALVYLLI
jgi:hypothetical protein